MDSHFSRWCYISLPHWSKDELNAQDLYTTFFYSTLSSVISRFANVYFVRYFYYILRKISKVSSFHAFVAINAFFVFMPGYFPCPWAMVPSPNPPHIGQIWPFFLWLACNIGCGLFFSMYLMIWVICHGHQGWLYDDCFAFNHTEWNIIRVSYLTKVLPSVALWVLTLLFRD